MHLLIPATESAGCAATQTNDEYKLIPIVDSLLGCEVLLDPNFEYDPSSAGHNGTAYILVGLGNPKLQKIDSICILNHKGAGSARKLASVSEFVLHTPDPLLDQWRSTIGAASRVQIVVEDLSLDTCFALGLFFARIANYSLEEQRTAEWVRYVTEWEKGSYPDAGKDPRDSLACLASLLGHSYLQDYNLRVGLASCAGFIWQNYERFETPRTTRFSESDPEYRRALARHAYEYEQFKLVVKQGTQCQLLLPACGSKDLILTDAILIEEPDNPSAILKTWLRTDREFSWTKRGFGLLALHRPKEPMSGNDMTISVDPDTYLCISELWHRLEECEERAWDGRRPKGGQKGRRLESHLPPDRFPDDSLPHQPWYDGRYPGACCTTLIAAPKAVQGQAGEESGTRLDWRNDVLATLWDTYSPIPSKISSVSRDLADSGKRIALVDWNNANVNPVVASTPTFLRWLAAQSMIACEQGIVTGRQPLQVRSPLDLPLEQAFDVVQLPGGLAIIHREGITLFDDWTATRLDKEGLATTAEQIAHCLAGFQAFFRQDRLGSALALQQSLLEKNKFSLSEFHGWRKDATAEKAALLSAIGKTHEHAESYDQGRIRALLERFWGLTDTRGQVLDLMERTDQLTHRLFEQLKEKRDRLLNSVIAGVGLGFLLEEILKPFRDKFTTNMYEWQIDLNVKKLPLPDLEKMADAVSNWELISVLVFISGFTVGSLWYWNKGSKFSAE